MVRVGKPEGAGFPFSCNSSRANRAQYSNISFQGIAEEDIQDVSLPSMQGTAEDNGELTAETYLNAHAQ